MTTMHTEQLPERTREAYGAIKRQIIELALPPGAAFTEAELAAALEVSKTPVREALLRLRQEGLVEAVARSGYRVRPVTVSYARDLFSVHVLLAAEAAGMAARHGDDLGALASLVELAGDGTSPSGAELLASNTRFHVAVAVLAGNDLLAKMLELVWEQLERLFRLALTLGASARDLAGDRTMLLSAVKAGDAEAARRCIADQAARMQLVVLDLLLSSDAVVSANIAASGED